MAEPDGSDMANLSRSIRDAAKRQGVSEHEIIWQLIEVCDTNGYAGQDVTFDRTPTSVRRFRAKLAPDG